MLNDSVAAGVSITAERLRDVCCTPPVLRPRTPHVADWTSAAFVAQLCQRGGSIASNDDGDGDDGDASASSGGAFIDVCIGEPAPDRFVRFRLENIQK
jgi:hypothetical protein